MSDRRQALRRRTRGLAARVRPGHRVAVLNVSATGALLEASRPLRPGTAVEVQFERDEHRVRVSAMVVRCHVASLDPHSGPRYRAGIVFTQMFDWTREPATRDGYRVPDSRADDGRSDHGSQK